MDLAKVKVVVEWPVPSTCKHFLGYTSPQGNGQAERANQDLGVTLGCITSHHPARTNLLTLG